MKNQIKNLILFLALVLTTSTAFCFDLTYDELYKTISEKINLEITEQLKEYSNDFKISINGIPKQTIETKSNQTKVEIIGNTDKFSPISYRRVLIKDENNSTIKAFAISIKTNVYQEVLCATSPIAYGEKINTANTALLRKEISKYLGKTYSNTQINSIAKRNYQKDSIILSDYTKSKAIISKNSDIDIIFQSKTINIKLRGKALKDGYLGDTILVRSDKYNKTFNGIIKSENEVIVRI